MFPSRLNTSRKIFLDFKQKKIQQMNTNVIQKVQAASNSSPTADSRMGKNSI